MKAITLKDFGGIDNLVISQVDTPVAGDDEVLVEVKAISINPVDVKTRAGRGMAGRLKEFSPIILGWDISGVVKESKSPLFKTGDEVFGMVRFPGHGKAYAAYVAAPASHLAHKPANISHEAAAGATLAALTAWQAIVEHAKVQRGQRVLIHAASGGVGHYAVQIAKYLGAYVTGTSSAANRDFVLSLGADEHVDYRSQKLEDTVSNIDFALDAIGGGNIDNTLKVMKKGGTIISLPSGLNEKVAEKAKAHGVNGFTFMVSSNGEQMKRIAELLEKGIIRSHVSETFAFEDMGKAHLKMETGKTVGKIIVTV